MSEHEKAPTNGADHRHIASTTDKRVAQLSIEDAIAQCPTDTDQHKRARELLREALQLMEADR